MRLLIWLFIHLRLITLTVHKGYFPGNSTTYLFLNLRNKTFLDLYINRIYYNSRIGGFTSGITHEISFPDTEYKYPIDPFIECETYVIEKNVTHMVQTVNYWRLFRAELLLYRGIFSKPLVFTICSTKRHKVPPSGAIPNIVK
jgi:hypothetical protein